MSITPLSTVQNTRASAEEMPGQSVRFRPMGKKRLILTRFLRNRLAVFGVFLLALLSAFALFGHHLTPWQYTEQDFLNLGTGPSAEHWLGTNSAGVDMVALLAQGTRTSLMIGLIVGVLTPLMSLLAGCAMAYFGKWVDRTLMWLIEALIMFPQIILIGIIMTGRDGGPVTLAFIMVFFGWMASARLIRGMSLSFVDRDFVKAARFMGVHPLRIVWRHLAPNLASLAIINATTSVWGAILAEISLSFLGIGVSVPETSLGLLIFQARSYVFGQQPWMFWAPVIAFGLIVAALMLINDGLRDALDPESRAGGRATA
ncbi:MULTISPECIES: ABC transporter permease [Nesterenkonia]|uniref:Oligopeptide transport system permease protein OppC n=1 Tax=Nesterenkonia xinjiangensis TaxID=225327 RepID=A0A7Z0GM70_9MICC|nr:MULTISPECIES: ABC transporter permease [Nesterenkonia]MDZ5077513.1 ABC transporter permease [Nesterenkonia sp. HG001]NYJ78462.1 peptide/nickel transport system permease protein [Nesterenkonia xinjiangensis]